MPPALYFVNTNNCAQRTLIIKGFWFDTERVSVCQKVLLIIQKDQWQRKKLNVIKVRRPRKVHLPCHKTNLIHHFSHGRRGFFSLKRHEEWLRI